MTVEDNLIKKKKSKKYTNNTKAITIQTPSLTNEKAKVQSDNLNDHKNGNWTRCSSENPHLLR